MNVLSVETKKDFSSSIFLGGKGLFRQKKSNDEKLWEIIIPSQIIERETPDTAITLEEDKLKNSFIKLLKNKKVFIQDEETFYNLLRKLHQNEIQLLFKIVRQLFNENYSFHIKTYETDSDLEDLYFVIHYESDVPDEYIEQELLNLYEFTRDIDKDKTLWFVGFVSKTKDV